MNMRISTFIHFDLVQISTYFNENMFLLSGVYSTSTGYKVKAVYDAFKYGVYSDMSKANRVDIVPLDKKVHVNIFGIRLSSSSSSSLFRK